MLRRPRKPKDTGSIGESRVQLAVNDINRSFKRHAAMLPCPLDRDQMVRALYSEKVLQDVVPMKDWVTPKYNFEGYRSLFLPLSTSLMITFEDSIWPTLREEAVWVQPEFNVVRDWIGGVHQLYLQYERVKNVLRKMNRDATAASVRYYWPAVCQLCPGSPPAVMDGLPSRYQEPNFLSEYLQAIRETSATVAAMAMMPSTAMVTEDRHLALTFSSGSVPIDSRYACKSTFVADAVTFHI